MSNLDVRLNSGQKKTLAAIQSNNRGVTWDKVKTLLIRLGADVNESAQGSRIRASFHHAVLSLHTPHGRGENNMTYRNMCSLQKFLRNFSLN